MSRTKTVNYVLTSIQLPILIYCFYILFNNFLSCPNKEFLSWDANLRYITTLNMLESLRDFKIFDFLIYIFDTPTWPIFRNLIQTFIFILFNPSQVADVAITFITFIFLNLFGGKILYSELKDKRFLFPFLFLIYWSSILLSPALIIYSFSGMLEIQGALFLLLSVYYITRFYKDQESINVKYFIPKLFLSTFLLFQTKYPYGYMFLFSITILHIALYPKNVLEFIKEYLNILKVRKFKNAHLVFALILIASYIFIPKEYLIGKSKSYIKYAIALILVFDFYFIFFKNKLHFFKNYTRLTIILQWIFLPVIFWVLIHPDRFSSSNSTINHIQAEGHVVGEAVQQGLDYYTLYFNVFLNEAFSTIYLGGLYISISMIAFVFSLFNYYKKNIVSSHLTYSFILIISILGITFLTPNHQARHIYHLFPLSVITFLLFITEMKILNKYFNILNIFSALIFVGFLFLNKYNLKWKDFNFCYSGNDMNSYALPRWIHNNTKDLLKNNTLLINKIDINHVNKPDTELLLKIITYQNNVKLLINPKNKNLNIQNYHYLLVTGNSCTDMDLIKNEYNILLKNIKPSPINTFKKDNGCVELYELK